jgi:hypothetical protein
MVMITSTLNSNGPNSISKDTLRDEQYPKLRNCITLGNDHQHVDNNRRDLPNIQWVALIPS